MTKVMRKEARHTQRRDRASGVPLEILEHITSSYTRAFSLSKILVDLLYFASKFHTNVSMTSLALFTFWNDFNVDSKYSLEKNYLML